MSIDHGVTEGSFLLKLLLIYMSRDMKTVHAPTLSQLVDGQLFVSKDSLQIHLFTMHAFMNSPEICLDRYTNATTISQSAMCHV